MSNVVKIRPEAITPADIAELAAAHKDADAMVILVMDEDGNWFAEWSEVDTRDLCVAARRLQVEVDDNLRDED